MAAASKGNKEKFRLLDLSSDEDSEDLQLEIIPNRKKKITRKERNRNTHAREREPNIGAEVQCALCWAVRGTLLLWLLMLTWLCASLYDQMSTMQYHIDRVSKSSEGVGDTLQVCHTAAQELRANVTKLSERLSSLELGHQELSKRMTQAASELASVTDQLSAAPKLADMPKRLGELQITVANFGSKMQDFDTSLETAKTQASVAASGVDDIKALLHELEARTNDTIANVTITARRDDELNGRVTALNETLLSKVDALQTKIEQINKQMTTPAPALTTLATPSTVSTSTAVNNVTVPTTSLPPVAPAHKPNVVQ